jgi:hypothetical protein
LDRRVFIAALAGATAVAATGVVIATADSRGPVFIAGDQPVTEEQVRTKLQTDGYTDIRVVREGRYFEATGALEGKAAKVKVDSQTGRLVNDDEDDDD